LKKRIATLCIIVWLLVGLPIVDAAWQETGRSGNWILDEHTHWKTDDASGWRAYEIAWNNTGFVNFTQWNFLTELWGYGRGSSLIDMDMEQRATFTLKDSNAVTTVELKVWYRYEKAGIFDLDDTNVKLFVNGTKEAYWKPDVTYGHPIIRVWFFQNQSNSNVLSVQMRVYKPDGSLVGGFDEYVTVGQSWFSQVNLFQEVHAWGYGWMEGIKGEEVIKTNVPGEGTEEEIPTGQRSLITDLINFVNGLWISIKEVMPQPIQDFMSFLEGITGIVWEVIWLTWSIVIGIAPMLLIIFGFYWLNVGLTALHEQSVDPLFEAVTRTYQMFASFANTVINIAKTIWGFIKFW